MQTIIFITDKNETLQLILKRISLVQALEGSKDVPSPTLSHELFSSLLETLLAHDANAAIQRASKSRDKSTSTALDDQSQLRTVIEAASLLEARLIAVEWSQIALVALQATQVCFHTSAAVFEMKHNTFFWIL